MAGQHAVPARRRAALSLSLLLLAGCATTPAIPEWTSDPARTGDNGYIVYTGSGLETSPSAAQLAAEGTAIQDLANECSFAPKGARVENHFLTKTDNGFEAYAQVAVDYHTCTAAQQAVQPEDIKQLASAPFMEELKRYQDSIGSESQVVAAGTGQESAPPAMNDDTDFFLARQYVAYQKQTVILAPAGSYQPESAQRQIYLDSVTPAIRPIRVYYERNPRLATAPTTWSTIETRVRARYPRAFRAAVVRRRAMPVRRARRRKRRRRGD